MYFLYTLLLFFFALPLLLLSPKKRIGSFAKRMGFFDRPNLKKPIWIHAVSVGEVLTMKYLMTHLKQELPGESLVLSTITQTGQQVAHGGKMDTLIYFPFDFHYSVRRTLDRVDPKLVVIAETEIWPNFLHACSQRKIPVLWINGRISDKSYPRYLWIRSFLKTVLGNYTQISMQSEVDCQRVKSLGVDPKKVFSVGNLKYDIHCGPPLPKDLIKYLSSIQPLWIAASTMPQEEAIVLDAFRQAREGIPELRLLIAPRHPERFDEVERLIEKSGFSYTRRSHLRGDATIILLDSLGELARTFEFACVVFVGGSLVAHGGHNILEPAFFAKPILFGPHMENFREIASRFLQEEAAITVQSSSELTKKIIAILSDDRLAKELGANAKRIVDENRGATQRTVNLIREQIGRIA